MHAQVPQNIHNIDVLHAISSQSSQGYPLFLFQKDQKILAWLKIMLKKCSPKAKNKAFKIFVFTIKYNETT